MLNFSITVIKNINFLTKFFTRKKKLLEEIKRG